MDFTGRCDFVQGTAHQSAPEDFVDGGDAERQKARVAHHPGGPLQGQKALAKLLVHRQIFEDAKLLGSVVEMFMVCSNVAKSTIPVKPQGNGSCGTKEPQA